MPYRTAFFKKTPSLESNFCSDCGTPTSLDARFCSTCGQEFGSESTSERTEDWAGLDDVRRLLAAGNPHSALASLKSIDTAGLPLAEVYRGLAYLRVARVDDARASLDAAVATNPKSFSAWAAMAEYHARLGYFDRAVAALDRALACEAPLEARQTALEFRRQASEKSRDIYYRQTSLPRLPRALRFWTRAGPERANNLTTEAGGPVR